MWRNKNNLISRNFLNFFFSMAATCFVQPLDLVKNRMQVMKVEGGQRPSSFSVLSNVVKNEGVFTLYNGLSAGLMRQATYTTTRLGIYTWLFETFSNPDGSPPGFFMKAALGMTAGCTGAFVGTPAEVHSVEIWKIFCQQPDFTWNQFWHDLSQILTFWQALQFDFIENLNNRKFRNYPHCEVVTWFHIFFIGNGTMVWLENWFSTQYFICL